MSSFYVPLLIRLEIKTGSNPVHFDEDSKIGELTPTLKARTKSARQRLISGMKKRSPQPAMAPDSDAPLGPPTSKGQHEKSQVRRTPSGCKGRRTYSEVVLETFEGDRLTEFSFNENEPQSSQASKAASEPPDLERLNYYSGNPFVEKTEGILHFFKYNDETMARETQCRMLCMLSVPSELTCRELATFIGPSIQTIEQMKIIRDPTPNQYMVIAKFKTHHDCVVFFEEFNGQQFNSMEPNRCSLLFVDRIESVADDCLPEASEHLTELPTCAVCLERMDDGVLTILCNHTFHANCLQKWTDTTCPVCRYTQTPELVADQRCSDCGQSTDLWICLICGNIGCGRYAEAHAYRHFESTSHTFCLQIGGERVWDYAGDNYVHRLIQADESGKMVEYQRAEGHMADKDTKMEAIKMEYACLLTEQLDNQRRYYERRLADAERTHSNFEKMAVAQMEDLEAQLKRAVSECESLRDELSATQQAKAHVEKKQQANNVKLNKALMELKEEKSLNEMHRNDHRKWVEKVVALETEKREKEEKTATQLADLQDQLNDLMMHFEAQNKLQEQLAKDNVTQEEISGSSLEVHSSPKHSNQRRRSHRK